METETKPYGKNDIAHNFMRFILIIIKLGAFCTYLSLFRISIIANDFCELRVMNEGKWIFFSNYFIDIRQKIQWNEIVDRCTHGNTASCTPCINKYRIFARVVCESLTKTLTPSWL